MSDFSFDVPQDAIDATKTAMKIAGNVELPFLAPLFWWHRGEASSPHNYQSGVRHYGGWAGAFDQVSMAAPNIPEKFSHETFTNNNGNAYEVFAVRSLPIAPIAQRFRLMPRDEATNSGGRSQLQILAIIALFDNKTKVYTPWSVGVLSAKGMSGKSITDALKDWERQTAVVRHQQANSTPANFFYCHIGTFGDKREQVTVGQRANQGFITPAKVFSPKPEDLTIDFLKRTFVGKEMAEKMAEFAKAANEWLHDWDGQGWDNKGKGQRRNGPPEPEGGPDVTNYPPPSDEEFPF